MTFIPLNHKIIPFSLMTILPSLVPHVLNPCSLRAFLNFSIRQAVKLFVIDIPGSFKFFLFEKTFLRMLCWRKLTIIGLFFRGLGFSIRWFLSMYIAESSLSYIVFYKIGNQFIFIWDLVLIFFYSVNLFTFPSRVLFLVLAFFF